MKTKFYYFLVMICVALVWTSCNPDEWEMKDPSGTDAFYGASAHGKPVTPDTVYVNGEPVYVHDTVPGDPIVITEHDTVTIVVHDTINPGDGPAEEVTLEYILGSNKTDNGSNYFDVQPTNLKVIKSNGVSEVVLNTDVNRSAEVSNNSDTMFVAKVDELLSNVSRPATRSSYDVRGEYDINTGYRDYTVTLNDGSEYQVNTEAESASGMYEGEKKDLLYRMVQGIKVVSVDDEMTNDTIVKGKKIYRKANRTMKVEVESLNRPLMGPEIVTLDTLTIASAVASKTNGIAVVYVEDHDVPEDTVPVIPTDTVTPEPIDTVTPTPTDTVIPTPDDGYTINGEKIESIDFSYTVATDKSLKEVLLVRTAHYVMPVVSKQMLSATRVANPNDYNSVVWLNNAWAPAYLNLSVGFEWQVNGNSVLSATDGQIDIYARHAGINSISRSDFLKHATFVNEGKTTRVYVDGKYYMTLK